MKPLKGIKVVDFTQAHAGSLCTMLLADFGAEVIKIERAGIGDLARYWAPMKDGESGYFTYLNRGKKSISVNVASPEGKKIILDLVKGADVVAENFKFGSMERMGLSEDVLKEANPNIIYASLNGFGQTGPQRNAIGLDLQLQAMSGMMDRTGFPDGPPTKVGAAIGDQVSGTYMALGIMLALVQKKKSGQGERVDIAILDSLFSVLEAAPITQCLRGEVPLRAGNSYPSISPYDSFRTNDGFVAIGVATDQQWVKFCEIMQLNDLAKDERYKTNESRGDHYMNGLKQAIEAVTITMSKFDIEAKLRSVNLACGAVCTVKEAMQSEYIKSRNMLQTISDKALGQVTMPGTVIRMSKTPGGYDDGAPLRGEHTVHYLKKLNRGDEEIAKLREAGLIETA